MKNTRRLFFLFARIVVGLLYFQTLFFKFTGVPESVYIFETLGVEPWGRWGSGLAELVCIVLLAMPKTVWLGALLSLGVISGAILSHLLFLGIVIQDDGGLLFVLAMIIFVLSLALLWIEKNTLLEKVKSFK